MLGQLDLQVVNGDHLVSLTVDLDGILLSSVGVVNIDLLVQGSADQLLNRSAFHSQIIVGLLAIQQLSSLSLCLILQSLDDLGSQHSATIHSIGGNRSGIAAGLNDDLNQNLAVVHSSQNLGQQVGAAHLADHHFTITGQNIHQLAQVFAVQINRCIRSDQSSLNLRHNGLQIGNLVSVLREACFADHNLQCVDLLLVSQHIRQIAGQGVDLAHDHFVVVVVVSQTLGLILAQDVVDLQLVVGVQVIGNDAANQALEVCPHSQVCFVVCRAIVGSKIGDIDHTVQSAQLGLIQLAHGSVICSKTIQGSSLLTGLSLQGSSQCQYLFNLCLGEVGQIQDVLHLDSLAVPGSSGSVKAVLITVHTVGVGSPAQAFILCIVVLSSQLISEQLQQTLCIGRIRLTVGNHLIAQQSTGGQNCLGNLITVVVGNYSIQIGSSVGLAHRTGNLSVAHYLVYIPLSITHAVDIVVVSLGDVSVGRQSQLIAIRYGQFLCIVHRHCILSRQICHGVGDILSQSIGQLGGLSLKLAFHISTAPGSLCIGNDAGFLDCSQNLVCGYLLAQRDHQALVAVGDQLSRVCLILNHLQNNIDGDIKHAHILLQSDLSHRQRILNSRNGSRNTVHSQNQLIQLGVICSGHAFLQNTGVHCVPAAVIGNHSQVGLQVGGNTDNGLHLLGSILIHPVILNEDSQVIHHGLQGDIQNADVVHKRDDLLMHGLAIVHQVLGLGTSLVLLDHHTQVQLTAIGLQLVAQAVHCILQLVGEGNRAAEAGLNAGGNQLCQLRQSLLQNVQVTALAADCLSALQAQVHPGRGSEQLQLQLFGNLSGHSVIHLHSEGVAYAGIIAAHTVDQLHGLNRLACHNDVCSGRNPLLVSVCGDYRILRIHLDQRISIGGNGVCIAFTNQQSGAEKRFLPIGQLVVVGYQLTVIGGGCIFVGCAGLNQDAVIQHRNDHQQSQHASHTPLQKRRSTFHLIPPMISVKSFTQKLQSAAELLSTSNFQAKRV